MSEKIIVLKEKDLFKNVSQSENFFFHSRKKIIKNILSFGKEYEKELAENDLNYKQIVSYMIFSYKTKLFLMQRKKTTNILSLKYSLGIGGHLRRDDIKKNIGQWGDRELQEEVKLESGFRSKLVGFINDNSNEIGKKHFGLVYLIDGKSSQISIISEMLSGKMIQKKELSDFINNFESWSLLLTKKFLKIRKK
jgi:predicted NUDIX family phosphoesterase